MKEEGLNKQMVKCEMGAVGGLEKIILSSKYFLDGLVLFRTYRTGIVFNLMLVLLA